MAKKSSGDGWGGLLAVGAVVVGGLWLMSAAASGKRDAKLVPNWIEGPIDNAVEALNNTFGRAWVSQGITTIQRFLLSQLPSNLAPMAAVIFEVEQAGRARGWTGQQKKREVTRRMS